MSATGVTVYPRGAKMRQFPCCLFAGVSAGRLMRSSGHKPILPLSFLTWKIYFPSCSGGLDFTPSLYHFLLDIWKPRGCSHMKLEGNECSSENLILTPMGDLRRCCLSFIIPLKKYHLKRLE